jgi:FemAB-related protein (PEP-CTERM system-associated)
LNPPIPAPVQVPALAPARRVEVRVARGPIPPQQRARLEAFLLREGPVFSLSLHPGCANAVAEGLGHSLYCLEAVEGPRTRGFLLLNDVRSRLFGRFLVSLPYLNYGGAQAEDDATAALLIDRAVALADELGVRHLELRHEHALPHPALNHARTDKAQMRLDLPATAGKLLAQLGSKLRSQVNKARKNGLTVAWGAGDLLREFYAVFSHNMRDLGTPVYGRALFRQLLDQFPGRAELCVVRAGKEPAAAALLLHGWGITEVPSASSLRRFNPTAANMLLYWQLLERSIERGQDLFDFGRSSKDSGTYRFKQQWGATPVTAEWQYYVRSGSPPDLRADSPRYRRLVGIWKRLPVPLTRWIGPTIVRGIP